MQLSMMMGRWLCTVVSLLGYACSSNIFVEAPALQPAASASPESTTEPTSGAPPPGDTPRSPAPSPPSTPRPHPDSPAPTPSPAPAEEQDGAPAIGITSPTANFVSRERVTIAGTCGDGNGIATLAITTTGQSTANVTCTNGNYAGPIDLPAPDGDKIVVVTATDALGSDAAVSVVVKRDETAPVATLTSANTLDANTDSGASTTLRGGVTDSLADVDDVEISIADAGNACLGAAGTAFDGSCPLFHAATISGVTWALDVQDAVFSAGATYTVTVRTTDTLGNTATAALGSFAWADVAASYTKVLETGGTHSAVGDDFFFGGSFTNALDLGGGVLPKSSSNNDLVVARFTGADGALKWAIRGAGTAGTTVSATRVMTTSGGDVVVVGSLTGTYNFGGGNLTSTGSVNDVFLAKFSGASGAHVWSHVVGSAASGETLYAALDPSDNILLGGIFFTSVNLGGATLTGFGSSDIVVAKFNSSGNHIWSATYGGTNVEDTYDVGAASNGDIIIVGHTAGPTNLGAGALTTISSRLVYIARYAAANGSHVWSQRVANNGGGHDYTHRVVVDQNDDSIYWSGRTDGTTTFGSGVTLTSNGDMDGFIAKYSAAGTPLWARAIGNAGNDSVTMLGLASAGLWAAGRYTGSITLDGATYTADASVSASNYDNFLVHMDADGTMLAARNHTGPNHEIPSSLMVLADDTPIMSGIFTNTFNLGSGVTVTASGAASYLYRYVP